MYLFQRFVARSNYSFLTGWIFSLNIIFYTILFSLRFSRRNPVLEDGFHRGRRFFPKRWQLVVDMTGQRTEGTTLENVLRVLFEDRIIWLMAGNWCRAALTAATPALARFEPSFEGEGDDRPPLCRQNGLTKFSKLFYRAITFLASFFAWNNFRVRLATDLYEQSRNLLFKIVLFLFERKSIALPIIRKFFRIEFYVFNILYFVEILKFLFHKKSLLIQYRI